jgi:hypothetical protein
MSKEDFKKIIEAQVPGAFDKKVKVKAAAKATAKPKAKAVVKKK